MDDFDKLRRDFLVRALSSGLFATGLSSIHLPAWAMGKIPEGLPPGKSIYKLSGTVTIDDKPANLDSTITPNSVIETGDDSKLIFVVGKDAFIMRSNSKLQMQGDSSIISGLRLITGKLLSVFGKRKRNQRLRMRTVVATVGIRGTGAYLESTPEQTYICTCYGEAELAAIDDPQSTETVVTQHHDAPRYIVADAPAGQKIQPAPVINHTDEELELIESLVGRSVPFAFTGDYDAPRKSDY